MEPSNSTNSTKSVDASTKFDNNSTKSVDDSTKKVVKSVDDSTKIDKIQQKAPEKIVVKKGNVSELVDAPTKSVDDSTNDSTKSVDDSTKIAKVKEHKKKVSTKSLQNLNRKGRKSTKSVEPVVESVEVPKQGFNFPVKFLIIAAFIAGGTLGFLGLWNWWKNQKKSKENPDDVIEVYNDTLPPSQEELEQIAQMETLE